MLGPVLALLLAAFCPGLLPAGEQAPELPRRKPQELGMDPRPLERIAPLVKQWIDQGQMAGCVVAVGHRGHLVYLRSFGHRQLEPRPVEMTTDTLFDLASLTKPVATATSVMLLVQRGQLRLQDRVAAYLPEFGNRGKERITVLHLLTHQSGLTADNSLEDYRHGRREAVRRIMQLPLLSPPGERFRYSDVGFIVLGLLVEKVSGQPLDRFARENIFRPLGMDETTFNPGPELRRRAAATEKREGRWMVGEVHDPRAYLLGGVAGHAGLFSTAEDLARYAQMMLGQGRLGPRRVLAPRTVEVMTRPYRVSAGLRALGWDKLSPYSSNRGELMTPRAFGHGGFTGTGMWIDPGLDLYVIFLSNRLHPDGRGSVNRLIGRIGSLAAAAVQQPAEPAPRLGQAVEPAASPSERSKEPTRRITRVLCGVDVLQRQQMRLLWDKRVGLITNHTGRNAAGVSTLRLLHEHPRVKLVAVFSPEHGLHGKLDVPQIDDTTDQETGLRVYSLYGKTRKPTPEMLRQVDVLVFDIQDIGTRFYTYISTMKLAMEAAAQHGKAFVVLDRPNPIGGLAVEGPVLDPGRESFVGCHRLPVRHGLTAGELARLFQREMGWSSLRLTVVPVEHWQRAMYWDQTLLEWVNPSPNMRSPYQALLYPGIGLLETTNLSVGRGTDTPFELIGAPWLDASALAEHLARQGHPGLGFVPVRFTPTASKYKGQECRGVRFLVRNPQLIQPVRLGLAVALWLRRHHAKQWDTRRLPVLVGSRRIEQGILNGEKLDVLWHACREQAEQFRRRRAAVLLYR